jgi:hypothetical protein
MSIHLNLLRCVIQIGLIWHDENCSYANRPKSGRWENKTVREAQVFKSMFLKNRKTDTFNSSEKRRKCRM